MDKFIRLWAGKKAEAHDYIERLKILNSHIV